MKNNYINKYHSDFVLAAKLRGEAIKKGDRKTANKQYNILKRLFKKAQDNHSFFISVYKLLRNDDNADVRVAACAHSLALGIDINETESVLEQTSHDDKIGITRLSAEMTLKVGKSKDT